jgi:TatD DNase family protein
MFVDTHCHLQFKKYDDPAVVIDRSTEAGVSRMVCVGTSVKDSRLAINLANKYDSVWASVGVHPHEANTSLEIAELAGENRVVAIGEIGLDFFKNYTPKEDQIKALRQQLDTTVKLGLPYIFHVRQAWNDFWKIFDEYKDLKGVVHSFSSTPKHLEEAISRGLYIGLNGIMTFTNDEAQLEAAKQVPLDKLLLETDAPFLTPAPFRSVQCEPKHVITTAEFIANLRQEPLEELARATTENATRLFKFYE